MYISRGAHMSSFLDKIQWKYRVRNYIIVKQDKELPRDVGEKHNKIQM